MIKNNTLIYIYLGIISISCTRQPESIKTQYNINLSDTLSFSINQLELIDLVPLETNQSNLMSLDLRVKMNDDYIGIMDEGMKDGVHLFDKNGNYLNTIAQRGDGPNRIASLLDFNFQKDNLQILSTVGTKASVIDFTIDGNKTTNIDFNYPATSFVRINNNYYISGGYNQPIVKHRIKKYNIDGTNIGNYLENNYTNKMLPITERNYFQDSSKTFYIETFNRIVYQLDTDSIKPLIKVDHGNYNLPNQFWELDIMQGFDLINERGFSNVLSVYENNGKYLMNILHQSKILTSKFIILFNSETNEVYNLSYGWSNESIFHTPVSFISESELMFIAYYSELKKFSEIHKWGPEISSLNEMDVDYPVLFKVRLNL